jgi:hypothetical protein
MFNGDTSYSKEDESEEESNTDGSCCQEEEVDAGEGYASSSRDTVWLFIGLTERA